MRFGIKSFYSPPQGIGYFSSYELNQKLRLAEEKGDVEKIEKIKNKIEEKQKKYNETKEIYNQSMASYVKIRRFVAAFIGIASIIIGIFIADYFLGAGFIVGGAFCIFDATSFWWSSLSDIVRFFIIMGALLLLFLVGFLLVKHSYKQKEKGEHNV